MKAEFSYVNESGFQCSAVINEPDRIHHSWWSSRRNCLGEYEKHDVTFFGAFMNKLRKGKCKQIKVRVTE